MKIRSVSRDSSRAGNAPYAAAYRSGENLHNERTGDFYKYAWRKKEDVSHTEIVLPSQFKDNPNVNWARDRSTLWNQAEHAERNRNARVAREYTVVLPPQISHEQRVGLVRQLAQTIAERQNVAVDFAIHEPRLLRSEHPHAHLLATTREISPDGLTRKAHIEIDINSSRKDCDEIRNLWDQRLKDTLGVSRLDNYYKADPDRLERTSRESLIAQGIDVKRIEQEYRAKSRLTPEERVMVQHRKSEIRQKEAAEKEQKRLALNQRVRDRRWAMSDEERERYNWKQRDRYAALPPEEKEKRLAYGREYHTKNAVSRNQRSNERYYERKRERAVARSQEPRTKDPPGASPNARQVQEDAVRDWRKSKENDQEKEATKPRRERDNDWSM